MSKVSEEFGDLQFTSRTSMGCVYNIGIVWTFFVAGGYIYSTSVSTESPVAGDKSYRPGRVLRTWATYMSGLLCNVKWLNALGESNSQARFQTKTGGKIKQSILFETIALRFQEGSWALVLVAVCTFMIFYVFLLHSAESLSISDNRLPIKNPESKLSSLAKKSFKTLSLFGPMTLEYWMNLAKSHQNLAARWSHTIPRRAWKC